MGGIETHRAGSLLVVSIAAERLRGLAEGERAVVALAVFGLSNKEIAVRRGTSARTVANQLARACKKLGVRSRVELLARLREDERATGIRGA